MTLRVGQGDAHAHWMRRCTQLYHGVNDSGDFFWRCQQENYSPRQEIALIILPFPAVRITDMFPT